MKYKIQCLHSSSGAASGKAAKGESNDAHLKIANFPDLRTHNNWMAKCLTPEVWEIVKNKKTKSGITIDQVIQTGVDNPGHPFIYTVGKRKLSGFCRNESSSIALFV